MFGVRANMCCRSDNVRPLRTVRSRPSWLFIISLHSMNKSNQLCSVSAKILFSIFLKHVEMRYPIWIRSSVRLLWLRRLPPGLHRAQNHLLTAWFWNWGATWPTVESVCSTNCESEDGSDKVSRRHRRWRWAPQFDWSVLKCPMKLSSLPGPKCIRKCIERSHNPVWWHCSNPIHSERHDND